MFLLWKTLWEDFFSKAYSLKWLSPTRLWMSISSMYSHTVDIQRTLQDILCAWNSCALTVCFLSVSLSKRTFVLLHFLFQSHVLLLWTKFVAFKQRNNRILAISKTKLHGIRKEYINKYCFWLLQENTVKIGVTYTSSDRLWNHRAAIGKRGANRPVDVEWDLTSVPGSKNLHLNIIQPTTAASH